MTNAELIKKARAAADALTVGAQKSDAYDAEMLRTDADLFNGLADALEALEARVGELELENGQLILELGNIEKNTGDTQEAIRRIAHYRRGK